MYFGGFIIGDRTRVLSYVEIVLIIFENLPNVKAGFKQKLLSPLIFVSFSGLKNSETKLRKERKVN